MNRLTANELLSKSSMELKITASPNFSEKPPFIFHSIAQECCFTDSVYNHKISLTQFTNSYQQVCWAIIMPNENHPFFLKRI